MEVKFTRRGFLPPRVQLINGTDGITIPSPATGQIVYHTGISAMDAGIYINVGTTTDPSWVKGAQSANGTQGTRINKVKYLGRNMDTQGFPKPTLQVTDLNLEFRFAQTGTTHGLQIRLITAPSQTVIFNTMGHIHGPIQLMFTTVNYDIWQNIGPTNDWWAYFDYITTNEPSSLNKAGLFYALTSYGNRGTNITEESYFLAAGVYWFSSYELVEKEA